ncbi:FG-GAP-like repeat-containing protein [Isoptericola sp. NPDC057653]|uniref:FG-GAP-like repeat-containing protein n=1 Tax=Isoptericola sp. NPDC057653 TaxID=3346195 RepID=UPI0036816CE9
MRNIRRPGVRLASALVVAGLAVSVAPAAQADDSGILTLTDGQAETLADRITPDVYGDGRSFGDPRETAQDAVDAATADADAPTDAGTASSGASLTATSRWKLTKKSGIEGAQGMAATFPVGGADGDYFTVNGLTPIQRIGADGTPLWSRDSTSLDADWQITPLRGQKEPYPAAVVMGFNAVSPFTMASDDGVTTGDLTGDGVDDVVFTAEVGVQPYRPFTSPGSSLPNGTFVTVLDGATGKTVWSKLYAAVYNVKLVGKTLVIADSAFANLNSPAGSATTLHGIRFDHSAGALTPAESWTYDAGTYTGAQWGSLQPIGGGLLAASWNQARRYAPDGQAHGTTLVLDTADGSVRWATPGGNYVRQLHLDAARGRVVALEQADTADGVAYEIAAYDPADGARTGLVRRVNAMAIALEVGNIQGDSAPEYTVSESTLQDDYWMTSNSVRALDGDDASLLWSRTVKRTAADGDVAPVWGLEAVDGKIIASARTDEDATVAENRYSNNYARITALSGNKGAVKWETSGVVGSVMYAQPFVEGKGWRIRTVDTNQNVRVYNLGSGKQTSLQPLEGPATTAAAVDVDGDGADDAVLGGGSNGLYAYRGTSMVAGSPERMWAATLPGRVVQVVTADTTGDGRDELVVAASTAAAVVDARTGKVLSVMTAPAGEYVRNVVASDLDGDGAAEVAVATDKVRAYEGTGALKWEYAVPATIGTPAFADLSAADGKVYAQFQTRGKLPTEPVATGGVALDGKNGSMVWSFTPEAPPISQGAVLGVPLRAGTFASPDIPYADGHAVVFTYIVRGNAQQLPKNQLTNMVQIRDGRSGALLHEAQAGGYATLANWFTGQEGLLEGSLVSLRTYGADGVDGKLRTLPEIRSGSFATGPGGARVLVRSGVQFVALFDPAVMTAGVDYPKADTGFDANGAREHFVADLDGDGKDEILLLAYDDANADRTAGMVGNSELLPYTAIRGAITLSIDNA